jgi:hypothetical protein
MTIFRTTIMGLLLFLASACSGAAHGVSPQDLEKVCRSFVQDFYDWYVPRALDASAGRAWELALNHKGQMFSPELFRQLKEDSDAQKVADGDIVGLDGDPFLNCQDCGDGYVAGKITRKGDRCWVEVYRIRSGTKSDTPVVVAELMEQDEQSRFVDFHYGHSTRPEFESLVSQLRHLQRLRQTLGR